MDTQYPIEIYEIDGSLLDRVANYESALSVLFGDLSCISGLPRTIVIPAGENWDYAAGMIETEIRLNSDCYGLPKDRVRRGRVETPPEGFSMSGVFS